MVFTLSKPQTPDDYVNLNDLDETQLDQMLIDSGFDKDVIADLDQEDKKTLILYGDDFRYDRAFNRIYSNASNATEYQNGEELYKELLLYFEAGQYYPIIAKVDEVLIRHNLSKDENLKVTDIYKDAQIMSNYERFGWAEKELSLRSLANPESFVLSVIQAYPRRRESVICDIGSLSPYSLGDTKILGITMLAEDSEEYIHNSAFIDDLRNVYRVDFSYGEFDELYAYVLQTHNRSLRLAGIYSDKDYENIRSLTWWISYTDDREKGE